MLNADIYSGKSGLWGEESRMFHNLFQVGSSPLYIFWALLLSLLMATACQKSPTPGNPPPPAASISLSAEAGVIEAWLTLRAEGLPPDPQNLEVVLERDGAERLRFALRPAQGSAAAAETTVVDTGLLPAHSYTYAARLEKDGHTAVWSNSVSLTTMDTTSHNFSWQIYEFGGVHGSSVLYDVAIINENDIWAVGEIHTAETDTFDSTGNWVPPYNAVHWDGSEWELRRIYFPTVCGQNSLTPYPGKAVFDFDNDEIWISSSGDKLAILKNGNQIAQFCLPTSVAMSINKIWGTYSDNLYLVGHSGLIAYYDGSDWQRMESGTDVDLRDVWGTPDGITVWACGWKSGGPTVLLQYNNGSWHTIYEDIDHRSEVLLDTLSGTLNSGWSFTARHTYVASNAGLYKLPVGSAGIFQRLSFTHSWFPGFPRRVRGNHLNDISLVGDSFFIAHFNGATWKYFPELAGQGRFYSVSQEGGFICAVGRTYDLFGRAIILIGRG